MHYARKIVKYATVLILFLIATLIWVTTTESGLRWSWQQVQGYVPTELVVGNVSGSLSQQVTLSDIQWQDQTDLFDISSVVLDCTWLNIIFNEIECQKIAIGSVTQHIKVAQSTSKDNRLIAVLPAIQIPFEFNIQQINLASFLQKNQSTTILEINKVSLQQLNGRKSQLSFSDLSLQILAADIKIKASGEIDFQQQWQHQLHLALDSPNLKARFETAGAINGIIEQNSIKQLATGQNVNNAPFIKNPAKFKITTLSPYQSEAAGEWYWHQGPVVKRGIWNAVEQIITQSSANLKLNSMSTGFDLDWPNLQAKTEINLDWLQNKNIKLKSDLNIINIANWQQATQMVVSIDGELKSETLAEIDPQFVNQKNQLVNQIKHLNLPIVGKISADIEQGKVKLKIKDMHLGEVFVELNAAADLENLLIDNFSIDGKLSAKKLTPLIGFPVQDFSAKWHISKQKQHWSVDTQGKLSQLSHPLISATGLEWNVQLDEQWKGKIQAKSIKTKLLKTAITSETALVLHAPEIKLSGNANAHDLDISFSPNELEQVSIKLQAQLNLKNIPTNNRTGNTALIVNKNQNTIPAATEWHIQKLTANLPYNQQQFKIHATNLLLSSAYQKIGAFCIEGAGQACINGFNQSQHWFAEIKLEDFSLDTLYKLGGLFGVELPFKISGGLNGVAKFTGASDQLNSLLVDFTSPDLVFKDMQWETHWKNLVFSSEKKAGDYSMNVTWEAFQGGYNTPAWNSKVASPQGNFNLKVTPEFNFSILVKQNNILWTPPSSILDNHLKPLLIPEFNVQASTKQNSLISNFKLLLPGKDHIVGSFNSAWPVTNKSKIQAEFDVLISELEWLKKWQTQIDRLDGFWQQNLIVSGTLEQPKYSGNGELVIGNLEIDEMGLDIHDSRIALTAINDKVNLVGKINNKQGELNLSGDASFSPSFKASIGLVGEKLVLLNNQQNKLVITPNIHLQWQQNHLDVKGDIVVDDAKIKISSFPKQAITVSEDQIIVDQNITARSPFSYKMELNLKIGEKVQIDSFGLTSAVVGELKIDAESAKSMVVNGRLSLIGGQFETYKQVLKIEEGELFFIGAADNPGIQFKAVRKIDDIKVGVIANGSLASPRLTLYSEPPMAEEKILAFLLTGRSIESLTQTEGNALANAAISLGVEGANIIVQKLGAALGIRNLGISTQTSANSTRVDIGAQINQKLSVGYGATIDSKNEMNSGWIMEYQLSKNISFEAISGAEMTASISFNKQIKESIENKKETKKDTNTPLN
jgi:autotransporter translocation and assembly factor TamB